MIEIRIPVIPNAFKRQAEESDHHRICVEGKFWRPIATDCANSCDRVRQYATGALSKEPQISDALINLPMEMMEIKPLHHLI